MAAKTLATYIGELSAVSSLGAGDKIPLLESGGMVYVEGDDLGGGITALTGDVTASGTGSVATTIANLAVTNAKVATGIDAAKLADGSVSNTEFQYLGGVTSDIQTQLNAKQALDADLTTIAGLTPSNDDFLQRKAGAWANRTIAQVKTDLAVESIATATQTITGTVGENISVLTGVTAATYLVKLRCIAKCTVAGAGTVVVNESYSHNYENILISDGVFISADNGTQKNTTNMSDALIEPVDVNAGALRAYFTPPTAAAADTQFSVKIVATYVSA